MRRRQLISASAALLTVAACSSSKSSTPSSGTSSGTSSGSSAAPKTGGTLTLAPITNPTSFIPGNMGLGNETQYYQPVYDSLLRLSTTAEPIPNVATAWSYDTAQTTLTLTLRTDVVFTDGTKLDATAVKMSLDMAKKGTNESATDLVNVASVAVVDPTHVTIKLTAPDPSLLANLGSIAGMIASPKAISLPSLATVPVGSGPYILDASQSTANQKYTYTRNAKYWNTKDFPFDTIVLTPLTDPTAKLNALRSGQVNGTLITDAKDVSAAKSAGLTTTTYTSGDTEGVFIWDRSGKTVPALGKVEVRQALNYTFDKAAIVKTAKGGLGTPTDQLFNQNSTAFDPALENVYSYNPTKAKQMIAAAGYPNGFSVSMPDFGSIFPSQQAALVEELKAVGITPNIQSVPTANLITDLLAGKWGMTYFSLANFRSWDTVELALAPKALWNMFHTTDPTVETLISQAQLAKDTASQTATFKKLNAYIVQQAWFAPWDHVENVYVTTKGVTFKPQTFAAVPPIYNFSPA